MFDADGMWKEKLTKSCKYLWFQNKSKAIDHNMIWHFHILGGKK